MANPDRIEVYKGKGLLRRWYWRRRKANGRVTEIAAGGRERGYTRKAGATRAAAKAHPELPVVYR